MREGALLRRHIWAFSNLLAVDLLNILNVFVRWQQRCGLSLPILQQIVITIFISKQQKVIKALKVIAYMSVSYTHLTLPTKRIV